MASSTPRPFIRPLPERLINKIAAGEVVERPAAVVKELVENALDAGADRIDIVIEHSGLKLIRIIDNGCGIAADQMEIAFSRHATSKISEFHDLDRVTTYGFRGEALPSIASVSRMRMVSRPSEQDVGMEIIFEGGVLHSLEAVAAPAGTTVEVENLFFNVPARRKFLKAESTEARHISRTATALALGRGHPGFSYTLNGRRVFSIVPGTSLTERASALLRPGERFVPVSGTVGPVSIEGSIGRPELAVANRFSQYLFINGRYVQAPSLTHAFGAGYGEMLPRGMFPIGALLLTVDPSDVDVNVHPAKTEVRLSREREVYDAIYRTVKESLRQDGIIPAFRPVIVDRERTSPRDGSRIPGAYIPGVAANPNVNRSFLGELYRHGAPQPDESAPPIVQVDTRTGEIVDRPQQLSEPVGEAGSGLSTGLRLVGRFSDLYLILQAGDDLYIVDQHTAHERVLYEQTLRQLENHAVVGQHLLMPEQVELSPEQYAVFEESSELLNESGFGVAPFGGRTVNIEAVPAILSRRSPSKMILKVIDDLSSLKKAGHDTRKAMAQSIACRAAVMSGDRLTDREAEGLLEQLLTCENRYTCPHGRPTFIRIGRDDLDRQFGRG
ncbi:MAG: DNA mismatch repair endonuclease MutL [candidate division Zixibacteria bacterium]|jgi:DNA mismatch repair protein MutL|nr:DNA mismatch repair endonuclease MutL [candidate division Zixibacteria bacterium]